MARMYITSCHFSIFKTLHLLQQAMTKDDDQEQTTKSVQEMQLEQAKASGLGPKHPRRIQIERELAELEPR